MEGGLEVPGAQVGQREDVVGPAYLGSVVEVRQVQPVQGSGLLVQVGQESVSDLCQEGILHLEILSLEDQPSPLLTSVLTVCLYDNVNCRILCAHFFVTASRTD